MGLLVASLVPSEVIPDLCGATLLSMRKKSGGIRPIAVGEVLRCLTSKCILRAISREASDILCPLQVGVGVPLGCEAIVHAMRCMQDDSNIPPGSKWSLLLDFSNAFNCIDRARMFEEVRARIPLMADWLECCYGAQSPLHLGDHTLLSCCGVQQATLWVLL